MNAAQAILQILSDNRTGGSSPGGGQEPVTPINPSTLSPYVWIDASDYAVGAISNGSTITNKGSGPGNFTVNGTTLTVQINADGKKEFVLDGNTSLLSTNQNYFVRFHNSTESYSLQFVGKLGNTSNPDAFYGICGNSGGTALAHGVFFGIENRVAQPSTKGLSFLISRNVAAPAVFLNANAMNFTEFNARRAYTYTLNLGLIMDYVRLFRNGDLCDIKDRARSAANTTSGLGAAYAASATNPTNNFEIGGSGAGTFKLVGKMEQFIMCSTALSKDTVRGLESYAGIIPTYGQTAAKYININQTITDDYTFGGIYAKNASKSRTNYVTARGPDHFGAGSDRTIVQSVSTDDGVTFPALTALFADPATSPQGAPAGGYTSTGRLLMVYGKQTNATGVYNFIKVRYSDDDGVTWSSEIDVGVPVTSPTLTFWNILDKVETCDNGDLIVTWYGTAPSLALCNLYVMRSSDNGLTWTHTLVSTSTTVYKNEGSIVNLGGGNLLAEYRVEPIDGASYKYEQFFSSDNGVNWVSQGTTNLGVTLYVYPHPPMLRRFDISGVRVIAFYFYNRGTRRMHVIYARASSLISSGLSAWTGRTVYTLDFRLYGANNAGWRNGYPNIIHPDNDLKSEGMFSAETVLNDICTISFFKIDNEHEAKIKTELSIA
jgi:hypothetical protein